MTLLVMPLENFIHVLNPNNKNRSAVRRFFKKNPKLHGIWVDRTQHPTHLETIVDWALLEEHSHVAIWGGDGSFSRVVHRLYETDSLKKISLLLIPAGTGNDFSRHLKFSHWKKWIKQINEFGLVTKPVDVGLLHYGDKIRAFMNNAGFGRTKEALNRKKSNPITDILSFTEKRVQIEWGTSKIHQFETTSVLFGIVFNAPYFNKGMYFAEDIKSDDGILSGFMVPVQSKSAILKKFLLSKFGLGLGRPTDIRLDAEFINVESDHPLYLQVDGETVSQEAVHSLSFTVLPEALKLMMVGE